MQLQNEAGTEKLVYYRLIALWILCEAMLGGIIHGAKIPASGLIVGSCAVICISLIAYHVPAKGSILKATLIVAIFKMMLSPQAPPPAYFALFFQGLMGETLFWNRRFFTASCLLFAVLVLLESGLQRIVIMTFIYGKDFWEAMNTFINGMTGQATLINYSFILIAAYVLVHIIAGLAVGFLAGSLPYKIHAWTVLHKDYLLRIDSSDTKNLEMLSPVKRNRKIRNSALFIWLVLLLLFFQSSLNIGHVLLPENIVMRIFVRSLLIILTYYFVVGPCLTWLLNKRLQKSKVRENEMIQKLLQFLPDTKQIVNKSWQLAADNKGTKRILLCGKIILINTLHSAHD